MNWIFEAYSNVYNAAMMQDQSRPSYIATAKNGAEPNPAPKPAKDEVWP
jgi:hypothetical protein